MLKKILSSCLCLIFLEVIFLNISNAVGIEVTREKLTKALQEFVTSESNDADYEIKVEQNIINITIDNENYVLKYDLTDKPTFTLEIPVKKGDSYDEFEKKTDKFYLPMLGYLAVANVQGVKFEDSKAYFLFSYIENFNGSYSSEGGYWVVDDLNMSEGVTVVKNDNPKTIYTSEFGDRVMEYVNYLYKETQIATDAKEINSYTMTIEKIDITDTSCKLVSTLIVNPEADFTKINGYMEKIEGSFMNNDITKDNADYYIRLKVGQKCNVESNEKLAGYELYGGCVEIDTDAARITAIEEGNANGYLYIGDEKKSFYIAVEKNEENNTLETITLNIEKLSDNKKNEKEDDINKLPDIEKLPETGKNKNEVIIILYIIIGFGSIALINILLSYKKK